MRKNDLEYSSQVASNLYIEGREVKLDIQFSGACACGDTIQTLSIAVPDHGQWRRAYIGWCMDCQRVCASLVTEEIVSRPLYRVQG